MKQLAFYLLILTLAAQAGMAQRRVIVPEGFGTLNEILRKDTLAGGARKDPNTIYVLRRGGVYLLSGTILSSGFHLRLEAEEGTGPKPFVQMGFLTGGTVVEELFDARGDVTFRGLHVTGVNEFNTFIARIISSSSPNLRITFIDCLFDKSGQTMMRLNAGGNKVYMLNCTVSRMGRPSNPDNGRVIDERGNQVDSIVVENNTWYNITSRTIRDGGAEINYLKMNQNTFVNIGQRLAAIGQVNRLIYTNNINANPRFLGNSLTSSIVSFEFAPFGANPEINLNHNNFYYEQAVLDAYVTLNNAGVQRVLPPLVIAANQVYLDNATGILDEPLSFNQGPVAPTEFIIQSELGEGSSVPDWDFTGALTSAPWEISAPAYHQFSYPSTTQSFTGSSKGEPLGDLRWFPQYEVAWTVRDLVSQAENLVARESSNPVIGGNTAALAALQAAIVQATAVAENSASTGLQLAIARNDLQAAMNDFRASLVITQAVNREEINVFPNPTADYLFVEAPHETSLRLLGMDGRTHLQSQVRAGMNKVDVQAVPPGYYLLQVVGPQGNWTKKIIKQ